MNLPRILTSVVLLALVLRTPYAVLSAQEVQWRHDYNAARREEGLASMLDKIGEML